METYKNIPAFHAKTRKQWRSWLEKNHQSEQSVWLIIPDSAIGICNEVEKLKITGFQAC